MPCCWGSVAVVLSLLVLPVAWALFWGVLPCWFLVLLLLFLCSFVWCRRLCVRCLVCVRRLVFGSLRFFGLVLPVVRPPAPSVVCFCFPSAPRLLSAPALLLSLFSVLPPACGLLRSPAALVLGSGLLSWCCLCCVLPGLLLCSLPGSCPGSALLLLVLLLFPCSVLCLLSSRRLVVSLGGVVVGVLAARAGVRSFAESDVLAAFPDPADGAAVVALLRSSPSSLSSFLLSLRGQVLAWCAAPADAPVCLSRCQVAWVRHLLCGGPRPGGAPGRVSSRPVVRRPWSPVVPASGRQLPLFG